MAPARKPMSPRAMKIFLGLTVLAVAFLAWTWFSTGNTPSADLSRATRPDNELVVSLSDFGQDWPLKVSGGILRCEDGAVTFTDGTTIYAVNGAAKDLGRGVDIDPIWAAEPSIPGAKKNIGPLLDRGLGLCK